MIETYIILALALVGLCLGSFAGAMVWRLRARQLVEDKKEGEPVDAAELKRLKSLTKVTLSKDRSHCLHCGYELHWYDLIPLVSWLTLKGRCRNCHHPIGAMEPLIELGTAAFFVISYLVWPFDLAQTSGVALLAIWLAAGVGWAILFAYDARWFLLPDRVNFAVIGLGLLSAGVTIAASQDPLGAFFSTLASVGILSGIYLVLFIVSKGQWIGFGDVKLGIGLGLMLGDWQLAFLALFLANLIGCFIALPLMIRKKLERTSHIPFGPLLIAGTVIAQLWGMPIIESYFTLYM